MVATTTLATTMRYCLWTISSVISFLNFQHVWKFKIHGGYFLLLNKFWTAWFLLWMLLVHMTKKWVGAVFLSAASTSCRLWNRQLVWDDCQLQIVSIAICFIFFCRSYDYLILCKKWQFLWTLNGHIESLQSTMSRSPISFKHRYFWGFVLTSTSLKYTCWIRICYYGRPA